MEVLNRHVTIRKFKGQTIDPKIVKDLIYSGVRASTTGNMQLYSVIVSKTLETKKQLAPLHFNQNVAKSAPVLLTFVADFNRFTKWCEYSDAKPGYSNFLSFFTASIDALLVAQNVCIAAENLGLGICYLGTTIYNAKEIINVLQLPKLTFPVTTIAVGYPEENPDLGDRIPLDGIIHEETYADYSKEKIKELYAFKENLESSKQFVKENSKQSLAQVFTDIRYTEKDNRFFSEKMLSVLKDQGFLS